LSGPRVSGLHGPGITYSRNSQVTIFDSLQDVDDIVASLIEISSIAGFEVQVPLLAPIGALAGEGIG